MCHRTRCASRTRSLRCNAVVRAAASRASATAAALLIGGGAGVLALTASRDQTTLRSVTSDQPDQPPATATEFEVSSTTVSTTVSASVAAHDEPRTVTEPPPAAAPTPSPPDDGGSEPADSGEPLVPAGRRRRPSPRRRQCRSRGAPRPGLAAGCPIPDDHERMRGRHRLDRRRHGADRDDHCPARVRSDGVRRLVRFRSR